MNRVSSFWLKTKEEIQEVVNNSNSIKEAINKLGEQDKGGKRKTFIKICNYYNIDLNEIRIKGLKNRKKYNKTNNIEEYFIENSPIARKEIKKVILKNSLKTYQCNVCGNKGVWNNKKLTLQLEHINGINNDNRLENLTFLCPNCHSQTETYGGKNNEKKLSNEEINKLKEVKNKIRKEEFLQKVYDTLKGVELNEFGWVSKVSKLWGVSHTQVRRLFKKYGKEIKTFKRK